MNTDNMSDAHHTTEKYQLRDGTNVTLRPIVPEDAVRLQSLHNRLSEHSIYQRFFEQLKELPLQTAKRLAEVDYEDRMALVAALVEEGEERIVGVVRYGSVPSAGADTAELAIVVEDRFHGQGLGTILLQRIGEYAIAHGIRTFLATVRHDNEQILRFVSRSGLPTKRTLEGGVWEIRIELPAETDEGPAG